MRTLLVLILAFCGPLLAAEGFWQQVVDTQQRFYMFTDMTKDANGTQGDAAIDAKFVAFNAILDTMKQRPFSVQNPQNVFFTPAQMDAQRFRLSARIRVNRDHGYTLAVTRDTLAQRDLDLQQRIYTFFTTLSADWTTLKPDALNTRIANELAALQAIDIKALEAQYPGNTPPDSTTMTALLEHLSTLRMHYYFYQDILGYLQYNPKILRYRSLLQRLQLGSMIALLNDNAFAAQINAYLRYVKLDLGRAVFFIGTILLAWLMAVFMHFRLYRLLQKMIRRKADATDEMMLSNIDNIRRPFFILILAFGVELAIEILRYPAPAETGNDLFFFVYLITLSYILVILIDNFFFHFLLKQTEFKNRKMRSELVNLILSIIKVIVFVVAGFIFLVHIGVNITGLVASLGIGGLAVALAAKDTLSNFFGLLKILSDNSFSQGDWIATGDVEGTVIEIGFISTEIRTFDNALITVPNEKLANSALKNYNRRKVGRRIKMHIGVTYGSDREALKGAIEAIGQMLLDHPDTVVPGAHDEALFSKLKNREKRLLSVEDKFGIKTTLMVYLDQLSASSMDILIYTFTNTVNWEEWLRVKQDIIFKIWEILDDHGLAFAFPSQSLYFDQENVAQTIAPLRKNIDGAAE